MAALIAGAGCAPRPAPQFTERIVILGFDGMDPQLVEQYIADGTLPNFAALATAGGGVRRLGTTVSPDSPAAWASFATGVNPGEHNIFDTHVRDPATYQARPSLMERQPGRFLLNYFPVAPPLIRSVRDGTSFWVTAGRAGVRSSILAVPVTFPPKPVPNGELLSGVPLPDLRGTDGTYSYFATDLEAGEEGLTQFGGVLARLTLTDGVAAAELVGPPDPTVAAQLTTLRAKGDAVTERERLRREELGVVEHLRVPMTIRWNQGAPDPATVTVELPGQSIHLREEEWSRWIELEFRANPFVRLHGMTQLYLVDATDAVRLYVAPIQWRPEAPPLPISAPPRFAADLVERLGTFGTMGWAAATAPLLDGRLGERAFLDDLDRAFDDRADTILSRLDRRDWNLLVGVIDSTDRIQHMMWRLIDPRHPMFDADLAGLYGQAIAQMYRRCDDLLGEVHRRLDPDTVLLVLSDHGFHSWRRSVNLNTWLADEGYLALDLDLASADAHPADGGAAIIDWSSTRAYTVGLGQIYVNLSGREAHGTVSPGDEYRTLTDELRAKLLTLTDPDTAQPIVRAVYHRGDVYSGPYLHNAADLQVGFADGYRVSWPTLAGEVPTGIVSDNMSRWSGDHGGFDYADTPGVLFANRPITLARPELIDVAPTVLAHFGLPVPGNLDGESLF